MPVVLKLGGSVVTEKDRPETVDEDALSDLATAIGAYDGDLVVIHGGGSFGHHHADRHDVSATTGTHSATAVTDVHWAMRELNRAVVAALQDAGRSAVPVSPYSAARRTEEGALEFPTGALETMLAEGFTPVLHGDVVSHAGAGATILSGDELVVELAETLGSTRVGLCSGVPGVLDDDGTVIDAIEDFEAVASVLGDSEATDVTGGMAAKVEALLSLEGEAAVFGPDDLATFLAGETPGTTIRGRD